MSAGKADFKVWKLRDSIRKLIPLMASLNLTNEELTAWREIVLGAQSLHDKREAMLVRDLKQAKKNEKDRKLAATWCFLYEKEREW